jgi:hypothetical protein
LVSFLSNAQATLVSSRSETVSTVIHGSLVSNVAFTKATFVKSGAEAVSTVVHRAFVSFVSVTQVTLVPAGSIALSTVVLSSLVVLMVGAQVAGVTRYLVHGVIGAEATVVGSSTVANATDILGVVVVGVLGAQVTVVTALEVVQISLAQSTLIGGTSLLEERMARSHSEQPILSDTSISERTTENIEFESNVAQHNVNLLETGKRSPGEDVELDINNLRLSFTRYPRFENDGLEGVQETFPWASNVGLVEVVHIKGSVGPVQLVGSTHDNGRQEIEDV